MKEPTLDFCKDIVARAPDLGDDVQIGKNSSKKRSSTSKAGGDVPAKKQVQEPKETTHEVKKEEHIDTKSIVLEGLEDVPTLALHDDLPGLEQTAEAELENYDDF